MTILACVMILRGREREADRQTDRQTETEREWDRQIDRENAVGVEVIW